MNEKAPEKKEESPLLRDKELLRQVMSIASYVGDGDVKVLPGNEWKFYYKDPEARKQLLDRILKGEITPEEADLEIIRPRGFSYDIKDVKELGVNGLVGKVRQIVDYCRYYDYQGLIQFLHGLKDRNADLETALDLFDSFNKNRVAEESLKALGTTGRKQLREALTAEARELIKNLTDGSRLKRIKDLLKMRWMQKKGLIAPEEYEEVKRRCGEGEVEVAENLADSYLDYLEHPGNETRKKIVQNMSDLFGKIQDQQLEDQVDDLMEDVLNNPDQVPEDIMEELQEHFSDNSFNSEDNLPPDFSDSFSPSMDGDPTPPESQEDGESQQSAPYVIEPPIRGYYQGGVYNSFDQSNIKWRTNHTLSAVKSSNAPKEHTIKGKIKAGSTIPLFLPRHYELSPFSLPSGIEVYIDEFGTYFLKNGTGALADFELGFGKNLTSKSSLNPTADDMAALDGSWFSSATNNYLQTLNNKSNVEKAEAIVGYMHKIVGLKYSTDQQYNFIYKRIPKEYFKEIERHKKADCDVSQTYFIALCRAAGIPSRIVTGYFVEKTDGKQALLSNATAHAWTEIWDEQSNEWKTIDVTPPKEKQDKKDQQEDENKDDQQKDDSPMEDSDIPVDKGDQGDGESGEESEGEGGQDMVDETRKQVDDNVDEMQEGEQKSPEDADPTLRDKLKEALENKKEEEQQKQKKKQEQEQGGGGENSDTEPGEEGEGDESTGEPVDSSEKGEGDESTGEPVDSSGEGEGGGSAGESGENWGGDENEMQDLEEQMQEAKKMHDDMKQAEKKLKDKIKNIKSVKDLKKMQKELEEQEMYDDDREGLEDQLQDKEDNLVDELKERLQQMKDDGFIDESKADNLFEELEKEEVDFDKIEQIENTLDKENSLYDEYLELKEEVKPLVDKWYTYFISRLPREKSLEFEEEVLTRRGRFDRRSVSKPRNLLFGMTQNPPILRSDVKPKFLASIVVDISGSMSGRMRGARKMLIFFSELFDRISKEYGYIGFSVSVFDDKVELVKDFKQQYGSPQRYNYGGIERTVKVRLMEMTMARGGTDMGRAVWEVNKQLNEEKRKNPGFLSAVYVATDAETSGELSGDRLTKFLDGQEAFWGEWWGGHIKSGFMLGARSEKYILDKYFGEDDSFVVPNEDDLLEEMMIKFDRNVMNYMKRFKEE